MSEKRELKVGDTVRFINYEKSQFAKCYPPIGTIGGVLITAPNGIKVEWEKGSTSDDDVWWCCYEDVELVTDDSTVDRLSHCQCKRECINVLVSMFGKQAVIDFCRCNIFQYRCMANNKNGVEDAKKAEWYENKLIELLEEEKCPFEKDKSLFIEIPCKVGDTVYEAEKALKERGKDE